jgi:putative lipoic acid-binding regulatory protein
MKLSAKQYHICWRFMTVGLLLGSFFIFGIFNENKQLKSKVNNLENKLEITPIYSPPTQVELEKLKASIVNIVGKEKEHYAVVVKGLKTGKQVSVNSTAILPPASVSKLPYAILLLQDIQNKKISFDDRLPVHTFSRAYPSDPLYNASANQTYRTILEYLIHASDNTAMMTLEKYFGGRDAFNARVKNELGVNLYRDPHETTAEDVNLLLTNIWNGKYLDFPHNYYLVYELMGRTDKNFDDRIVDGVKSNKEAFVVHKIGSISSNQTGFTYHDAGIVYGEYEDISIVVLNKKTTQPDAVSKIQQISKIAYETFNSTK